LSVEAIYSMVLINIWHPKGGTGKTTVATSLAIALSKSWGRTLYVEIGPVPVGVRILGVEADGRVHEGRGDVLAAYVEDEAQLSQLLEKVGNDVMAVVVDYPPCIKPGEGGLLVPVADWLSASTLEKMKAKVAVLNKDRGFEFKLATASEVVKLPFSYAVERAVAEFVPPVLVRPVSPEHKQFVEGIRRLADRVIELAGLKKGP